jgi:hypothetical protein
VGCDGFLEEAASWHHDSTFTKRLQSEYDQGPMGYSDGLDKRENRSKRRTVANENDSCLLRLRLIYFSSVAGDRRQIMKNMITSAH